MGNFQDEYNFEPQSPEGDLKTFIFESTKLTGSVVPRHKDPAAVAEFIIEKVDEKASLKVLRQVEKAASFYDTFEICPRLRELLPQTDGSDALLKRIVIDRTIGKVGVLDDIEAAKRTYESLASSVRALVELRECLLLHDVLNIGSGSNTLKSSIDRRLGDLAPLKESDNSARIEYLEIKEQIVPVLDDINNAKIEKDKILAISDRKERIHAEILAYLTIDIDVADSLQPWAAARLRRETWAPQPPEQIQRPENAPLKKDVAEQFRSFLSEINDHGLAEDEIESARIQILRAIKFFGEGISEEEEVFLSRFSGEQADLLSNEGFQLP